MSFRPDIRSINDGTELRRWYWRKAELVDRARELNLKTTASKFEMLDCIAHFLDTGTAIEQPQKRKNIKSKFNWHTDVLTPETIISDSYKNTQNVRRFFKSQLGDGFKFNIQFMEWMRENTGATLSDACTAYQEIVNKMKTPGFQTSIKAHNQFNQYTRDLLSDNPNLGMADVRRIWAAKIARPSPNGRHTYHLDDLKLIEDYDHPRRTDSRDNNPSG